MKVSQKKQRPKTPRTKSSVTQAGKTSEKESGKVSHVRTRPQPD